MVEWFYGNGLQNRILPGSNPGSISYTVIYKGTQV